MKVHVWILVPFCLVLAAGCGDPGPGGTAGALTGAATGMGSGMPFTAGTAAAPPKPTFKPEAKVASMTGEVKYVRAGAAPATVATEMEFQAGDVFWIADGATATFNLEDEGTATITGPGVIAMTNNERREWSVIAGKAEFAVKRTVGRDSFQVRTLGGLLRAKGTPPPAGPCSFEVAVADDGTTWYAVKEGELEVIDEDAELKMELDRAAESRTMVAPTPGTGAPTIPVSKVVAPVPLQTAAAGNGGEVAADGKTVAPAAATGMPAEWLTTHAAAGPKLAKLVAGYVKATEDLVNKAFDQVDRSEKLRASHKDLLEKAKAARDAKNEEEARKIKTELVANTREARALGRMAHQGLTTASLYWWSVDYLKSKTPGDAALEKATAKLAAAGELATKKSEIEKKVDGLRKRPKFAVPTMPFAHGKMPGIRSAGPGSGMSMSTMPMPPRPMPPPGPGTPGAVPAPPAP